jgi:hypothetical protein
VVDYSLRGHVVEPALLRADAYAARREQLHRLIEGVIEVSSSANPAGEVVDDDTEPEALAAA